MHGWRAQARPPAQRRWLPLARARLRATALWGRLPTCTFSTEVLCRGAVVDDGGWFDAYVPIAKSSSHGPRGASEVRRPEALAFAALPLPRAPVDAYRCTKKPGKVHDSDGLA